MKSKDSKNLILAENLKKYRLSFNKNAKDFAKLINIKYDSYLAYERGVQPRYDVLLNIVKKLNSIGLNVTFDDLLADEDYKFIKEREFFNSLGFSVVKNGNGNTTVIYDEGVTEKFFTIPNESFLKLVDELKNTVEYKRFLTDSIYTVLVAIQKKQLKLLMEQLNIKDTDSMKDIQNKLKAQYASTKKDIKK